MADEVLAVGGEHADVVVAPDGDGGQPGAGGPLGASLCREVRGHLPEPAAGVEAYDGALLLAPLRLRGGVDASLTQPVEVHRQQADTVREVTPHIGVHEYPGDQGGALGVDAGGGQ